MNGNRKRNRWGNSANEDSSRGAAGQSVGVSDEEALQSLLASAESRRQPNPSEKKDHGKHRTRDNPKRQREESSYYGPKSGQREDRRLDSNEGSFQRGRKNEWRGGENNDEERNNEAPVEKEKPNFKLSGALTRDEVGGNVYKGVTLKFREPPEARAPNTQWRLYVFKDDKAIQTMHVSKQSAYLIGRNEVVADVHVLHPSCSSQHAVLQYRALPQANGKLNCQPYLIDLESTNGTFINGVRLDPARYYQLKKGDVLKFGASTREYVLLTENTTSIS